MEGEFCDEGVDLFYGGFVLAQSGLPDEVDILISDHAFDVEKLD